MTSSCQSDQARLKIGCWKLDGDTTEECYIPSRRQNLLHIFQSKKHLRLAGIKGRDMSLLDTCMTIIRSSQNGTYNQIPEEPGIKPFTIQAQQGSKMSARGGSIAIFGAGSVGSAVAYSLLLRQVVADIILVDIDQPLCEAQVQDLSDATFLSNVRIRVGSVSDARQADIIIITAGAKQRPGDTRLDLIDRNYKVLKSILSELQPIRNDAILLIVANPVDILTHFAQRLSGLPKSQVLGSGTLLDSIRLKRILASKLNVADTSIHAFVIGEHGDSQCVAWSVATVHGTPLLKILPLSSTERDSIATTTRQKADSIIKVKGFTSYGVAAVTARICEAIIFDHRQVMPLSHWQKDWDVCLSLPAVLGRDGIISTFPLSLDEKEQKFLGDSARALKRVIEAYDEELYSAALENQNASFLLWGSLDVFSHYNE